MCRPKPFNGKRSNRTLKRKGEERQLRVNRSRS